MNVRPSKPHIGIVSCLSWVLLCVPVLAPADEVRFTVEDVNDDEFAAVPPPEPVHEVEYSFEALRSGHEELIPIDSRNLRNLSVTIENRGSELVRRPYLFGPQGWDFRTLEAIAAKATEDRGLTTTEKFIRIHEWKGLHVMSVLGGSYSPYNDDDFSGNPLRVLNQYGHAMCGQSTNTTNALLLEVPPAGSMYGRKVKLNAHRVGEAHFDGRWHAFDTTPGTGVVQWVYYESDNTSIAPTWQYLIAHPELASRTKPWSGFNLDHYIASATGETFDEREQFRAWDFTHDLRPDESVTMYFDMRGRLDRTSARQDNSQSYRCYSDYASAVFTYRPDLTNNAYSRFAAGQGNVKPAAGGLVPLDPSKTSYVVFPLQSTWCFVGAEIRARFRTSGKVYIAVNTDPFDTKLPQKPLWQPLSESQKEYPTSSIEGLMAYWVKCEFQGAGSGLSELEIASEVQMSRWSMPGLEYGVNKIRFEADDFDGGDVHITYRFDDRSSYHFYEPATTRYGRHIPLRIGGVLQQGSKKDRLDWRKGRFWDRLLEAPDERVPVRLELYKVSGSDVGTRVRTLVDRPLKFGFYTFYWDGRDDAGRPLPVGMYCYKLLVDGDVIHGERLYLYSEIWPRPNEASDPRPIVIEAAASVQPAQALVGQFVRFSVLAKVPSGETIAYAWDFGDGYLGSGQSSLHGYSRSGLFKATATAIDSLGNTARSDVSVRVFVPETPTQGPIVPRGKFAPRALVPIEAPPPAWNLAAAKEGAGEEPAGVEEAGGGGGLELDGVVAGAPLEVRALAGRVRLQGRRGEGRSGPDTCSAAGVLGGLPPGWTPQGRSVLVDVGGVAVRFTLDRRGHAKSDAGRLRLVLRRRHGELMGGAVPFRLHLKGDFANEWLDEGIYGDTDEKGAPVQMQVAITVDGKLYTARVDASLDAAAGRGARFSAQP